MNAQNNSNENIESEKIEREEKDLSKISEKVKFDSPRRRDKNDRQKKLDPRRTTRRNFTKMDLSNYLHNRNKEENIVKEESTTALP